MLLHSTIILGLLTAVIAAPACSCAEKDGFRKAVDKARHGDTPYAIARVVSEHRPSNPNWLVTYILRTNGCSKTVNVTTNGSNRCNGVNITTNKVYVLRLNKNETKVSTLSSCDVFREYEKLTSGDKKHVKRKVPPRCKSSTLHSIGSWCNGKEVKCKKGLVCREKKCSQRKCIKKCDRGKCKTTGCHFGWTCKAGLCVEKETACRTKCSNTYVCGTTGCETGQTCLLGKCYNNKS